MLGFPQKPLSTPDFSGIIYWSKKVVWEKNLINWFDIQISKLYCVYISVYIKSKTRTHLIYSQTMSCFSLGRDAHVPQIKKSVSGNSFRSQWWYFFIWEHSKILLQRVMNLLQSLLRASRDCSPSLLCWVRCADRIQLSVTAQCWEVEKQTSEGLI